MMTRVSVSGAALRETVSQGWGIGDKEMDEWRDLSSEQAERADGYRGARRAPAVTSAIVQGGWEYLLRTESVTAGTYPHPIMREDVVREVLHGD